MLALYLLTTATLLHPTRGSTRYVFIMSLFFPWMYQSAGCQPLLSLAQGGVPCFVRHDGASILAANRKPRLFLCPVQVHFSFRIRGLSKIQNLEAYSLFRLIVTSMMHFRPCALLHISTIYVTSTAFLRPKEQL